MEELLPWSPYGRSSYVLGDEQLWKKFFRSCSSTTTEEVPSWILYGRINNYGRTSSVRKPQKKFLRRIPPEEVLP